MVHRDPGLKPRAGLVAPLRNAVSRYFILLNIRSDRVVLLGSDPGLKPRAGLVAPLRDAIFSAKPFPQVA